MGDFNYRIGMSTERVKGLIAQGDLETLYENDQASEGKTEAMSQF
jgi:hypothetical protein